LKNYQRLKPKQITLFDFIEKRAVKVSREIARVETSDTGPNIVFIGGMHGNEPSGVLALHHVCSQLKKQEPLINGNIYALAGNLTALEQGERYIVNDLNRIWQADNVERALKKDYHPDEVINEIEEQIELWAIIDELLNKKIGPFIFVDLHTTSVNTVPFITMSDTIMNRQLAKKIPVPVVIGIEEHLSEPLLSYVNDLGFVSMAFEAGQHSDPESVRNHEALIWLTLAYSGVMKKIEIPKFKKHYHMLMHNAERDHRVYEIRSRLGLEPGDRFQMVPGFENFQSIQQGQKLAKLNGEFVRAPEDGMIFMPLYQSQGNDAFFVIKKIAKFWLGVSYILRRLRFYHILPLLPGVRSYMKSDDVMIVDTKVAKWYSKQILHLMGYRRKKSEGEYTLFIKRKYDYKGPRA